MSAGPAQLPLLQLHEPAQPRNPNPTTPPTVGDVYHALADPTRRLLLDELCKREAQSLFELSGRLAMAHGITSSRQAISQHLAVLEEAGLVRTEKQGRTKLHWFVGAPLKEVVERWPIPKRGRPR